MRSLLTLGLLLWTMPALAQTANTLAPKEIADGWLLLFAGDAAFGWTGAAGIKVTEGTLEIRGDKDQRR